MEIVLYREEDGVSKYVGRYPLKVVKRDGNVYTYERKDKLTDAGMFTFSFRMYPDNKDLPHRQDFAYLRWF